MGPAFQRLVCRCRESYQVSIHSKIAEASSSWVDQRDDLVRDLSDCDRDFGLNDEEEIS